MEQANMSAQNPHIGKLIEARAQSVKERREVAQSLALAYKRGKSENMQEVFVKRQCVIEAIDRALEDERRLEQIRQNTPQAGYKIDLERG
jgi:hypothetical protein